MRVLTTLAEEKRQKQRLERMLPEPPQIRGRLKLEIALLVENLRGKNSV